MNVRDRRVLAIFFFVSGATSLMLQVAWSKELSYLLGNTVYAVATVVASFMGGLGLGSALASRFATRIKNPIRAYAAMECAIAFLGAASIPLFRSMSGVFGALYALSGDNHDLFLLARFFVVFVMMALPVTLMGMTLPVVIAAVGRRQEAYEGGAGYFYGINTLGAMAGTLFVGFWMIPRFGLQGTCLAAGMLDALLALGAWRLCRRVGDIADVRVEKRDATDNGARVRASEWTAGMLLVGGIYGVSGAVAMIYEVGWFRLLALVLGPSVHAFSIMLTVFLAGVALGSVAAARWASRIRNSRDWFAALQGALGLAGLMGLALVNRLPGIYFDAFAWVRGIGIGRGDYIVAQAMTASVIVFLPTFIMGVMFPTGLRAFRHAAPNGSAPEEAVGRMYALNTVGAIIGSLAAGFFLIPDIGIRATLVLAAMLSTALGVALWISQRDNAKMRALRLTAATVIAVVCGSLYVILPPFNANNLNQGTYRRKPNNQASTNSSLFESDSYLLYYREGINTTVAVSGRPGRASLRVTGKPDASTLNADLYTQLFVGQVPMLFARHHRHAAVIGYGSGTSAGTMLGYPDLESLDIIEIERGIIDASKYFDSINHNPLRDPRAHLILEDGRIHMTYTDKVYDVIASEPSNPWISGVSNLFTVDFYRTARKHLAADGVFAQWIQLYDVSSDTFKAMIASLQEVFPHVAVFLSQPADVVVLASPEPIRVPWETLERRFTVPRVAADFRQVAMLKPADMLFYFLASDEAVREFASGAQERNSDDNVWLEHRMASEFFTVQDSLEVTLPEYFRSGKVLGLQQMVTGMPLESVLNDMVAYGYSMEPRLYNDNVYDALSSWRSPIMASVYADLHQMGQTEMSARLRRREQAESQHNANAMKASENIYRGFNDTAGAKAYIEQAKALAPDLPMLMTILGSQAYAQRDLPAAENFYSQVVDKPWSTAHYDALIGMAYVYAGRGQADQALAMLERAMTFNAYLPNAYQLAAGIYKEQGDRGKTADVVQRGLSGNPQDAALLRMAQEMGVK
jgi:spermidine synthase